MSTLSDRFKQLSKESTRGGSRVAAANTRKPRVEFKASVTKRGNGDRRGGRRGDRGDRDRDVDRRRNGRNDSRRGNDNRRRRGGKSNRGKPKQKKLTAEDLDKQMEKYRMQDPDAFKESLDRDLDEYNKEREREEVGEDSAATEQPETADE